MTKRLVGVYYTPKEAVQVVDNLKKQGFDKDEILLIANEEVSSYIPFGHDYNVEHEGEEDDRSFWEKVKDAFSFDETTYEEYTGEHKEAIRDGAILIYVAATRDYDSTLLLNDDIFDTKYKRPSVENIDPNVNETFEEKAPDKTVTQAQKHDPKEVIDLGQSPETETVKYPVDDELIIIERRRIRGGELVEDEVIVEEIDPEE